MMLIEFGATHSETSNISPLITALLGVLGAIIGVLATGYIQKLADQRKLENDRARDDDATAHKTRVLRALIRSELNSIIKTFSGEIKFIKRFDNSSTWVPILGFMQTIEKDISAIGLLKSEETERIMDAFYVYRERIWYIKKNAGNIDNISASYYCEPIRYELTQKGSNPAIRRAPRKNLVEDLRAVIRSAKLAINAIDRASRMTKPQLWFRP